MNRQHTQPGSVTLLVRGLHIDAQCVEGGVVHLTVGAQQKHKGMLGRLRQHLANALFRAADACHPGQNNGSIWVVDGFVGGAALGHEVAGGAQGGLRYVWPRHDAFGQAHYQTLLVHEGVKRHQDGRPVSKRLLRRCGQEGADDAHALAPELKNAIVDVEGGAA